MERQAQGATEQLSIGLRTLTDWANGFIVLLLNMIIAAIIFAVFYFIARGVRSVVRRMTRNRQTADVGLVLGLLAQWTIVLLGLLVALTIVAPSVKPVDLLSLLGIGGVAIGFAFKDILQNFVAGILILLRHPFRVGDQVIFASYEGTASEAKRLGTCWTAWIPMCSLTIHR